MKQIKWVWYTGEGSAGHYFKNKECIKLHYELAFPITKDWARIIPEANKCL